MIEPVPKVWHSEGSCLFRDGSRRKEKRKLVKRGGFRFLLPASPQKLASCQKKNGERVKRCFQEDKQKEENIFQVEKFVRYLLCCRKYLTKKPPPLHPQNQLTDPSRGSKFFSNPLDFLAVQLKRWPCPLEALSVWLHWQSRVFTTLQSEPGYLWPLRHLIRVMRRHYLKTRRQIWRQRHWEISLKEQPKGLVNIETHITFLAPKHSLSFFKKERYMGQYLCIFCSHFIISFFWLVTAWSWRIQ